MHEYSRVDTLHPVTSVRQPNLTNPCKLQSFRTFQTFLPFPAVGINSCRFTLRIVNEQDIAHDKQKNRNERSDDD